MITIYIYSNLMIIKHVYINFTFNNNFPIFLFKKLMKLVVHIEHSPRVSMIRNCQFRSVCVLRIFVLKLIG